MAAAEAQVLPAPPPPAPDEYLEALQREAAAWPAVPAITVAFAVSYTVRVPAAQADGELPSVARTLLGPLPALAARLRGRARAARANSVDVAVLSDVCGTLRPGALALLLSAPGHGKSTLLRALAGHIDAALLQGRLEYNGVKAAELRASGVHLSVLAAYVDQEDFHLPFLTVRETITFAAAALAMLPGADGKPLSAAAAAEASAERVERVIRLLHLGSCADTLVGNAAVRGVSGGERKRVTIAEALVSNARLLLLDEISSGLDASVTYDIVAAIRAWAVAMRGTVFMALQQPTPEVYALFEDVHLLREGRTVYHGARTALPAYLTRLGFAPPRARAGAGGDTADWLIELLTDPSSVLRRTSSGSAGGDAPRSTAALAAAWAAAAAADAEAGEAGEADAQGTAAAAAGVLLDSAFARAQYGRAYPRPVGATFLALLRRQAVLSSRNRTVLAARAIIACCLSLVLGLVWLRLTVAQTAAKLGLFVFCLAQMSFGNFPEIGWVVEFKYVCFKQIRAGMYPAWSWTLAATLAQVPIAAVESAAFSLILYFMASLARDGGRWAFFYLVVLLTNTAVGSLFRLFAYVVPTPEGAMSAPGPFIALQFIFAGFLIPPKQMGTDMWMVFLYYTSTYAYAARSLAHNEFGSEQYAIYPATNEKAAAAVAGRGQLIVEQGAERGTLYFDAAACADEALALECGGESYGLQSLRALNINTDGAWKWAGVGFLLFFTLLVNVGSARLVGLLARRNSGSRRGGSAYACPSAEGDDDDATNASSANGGAVKVAIAAPAAAHDAADAAPAAAGMGTLSFAPVAVAWRRLSYAIDTPAARKTLLQGVSGAALPGRLLALMGASGAGKTTLLDVIACRKTAGGVGGDICLNGRPLERSTFARQTAYCEQADIHTPLATVLEALHFSAALRLPAGVRPATRATFVAEVLALLELAPLAGRLVGSPGEAGGLSPSQRKVLTVAVELVSNAPVLFLDEPTTSLDAHAAAVVMRVVRRVADTGRTVITTVHQPSADVFMLSDDILLLQRGGWMAYFGPIGAEGAALVKYLEGCPGASPCPQGMNPASWMLDVLASPGADGASLEQRLLGSAHWAECCSPQLDAACTPPAVSDAAPSAAVPYAPRPFAAQLRIVLHRTALSYSRSLGYVLARIKMVSVLGFLFACVWYKAQQAVDCAPPQHADAYRCINTPLGVQAVVSVVFVNALFSSVVCMSAYLPHAMRERAVFYRERAAGAFAPEAYALANLLIELPWLLLTVLLSITPLYFMVGFQATADAYFFYILVIWLCVVCFISLSQMFSALLSTSTLAQAVASLLLPLASLFAGVYLPKAQLPNGERNGHPHVYWLWMYEVNPVAHAVETLVPTRFHDTSRPSTQSHTLLVPRGAGTTSTSALAYLKATRGYDFDNRWAQVGYMVAIAGVLQVGHLLAVRYKVHVTR